MSHPIDPRIAEQATKIASLHAEVEHLKIIEAAWIALKSESKYTPGGDLWCRAERVVELENEILKLRNRLQRAEAVISAVESLIPRGLLNPYGGLEEAFPRHYVDDVRTALAAWEEKA